MKSAANNRTRTVIVLATLALCALFCAQGVTALIADKALRGEEVAAPVRLRTPVSSAPTDRRRDPVIILRRNIFNSALGDLSAIDLEDSELPMTDLTSDEVETECSGTMRVIGTVVIPGDLERSLAAIVGTDRKAALHYGGTEVEGSRIRAIQSDAVVLQSKQGLCRLAMFQVDGPANKPVFRKSKKSAEAPEKKDPRKKRPLADRNAGLSDAEMSEGIERIDDRNFNLSRSMLNKVLDNAGKIIGIAAVAPKVENGESVGMEIRGIRPGTLLTKIGIKNSDILESVNGQSLSSPDAALGAYTTLRTADKFTLSVRRDGQSMMINYNLQ
jgi:general secretion pathway protein C